MNSTKKQLSNFGSPRNSGQTLRNKQLSGKSGITRRTFLLRTTGVLAGLALGGGYVAPNITTLSIPQAFASSSPLPQFYYSSALLKLSGHWKLDETSGSTAFDSSGNNNHGTLIGDPTWSAGALNFNSPGSALRVPSNSDLNNLDDFSIAMWVFADSTGESGKGRFISKENSFGLRFSNRQSMIYFVAQRWSGTSGKWRFRTETGESILGGWHHLVVTYKYSSPSYLPKLYLDGQLLSQVGTLSIPSGTVDNDPTPLYIGNRAKLNRTFFDGRLSDVRIYSHILAAHEVAHLAAGS